jgi:8-oxo-dGTP pyrophosphatase MutT (NUDIX family)
VILARDANPGIELLMLLRSNVGVFGGLWVFPGGRVDDDDPGDDVLSRARSAAVRETREEADIVLDGASLVPWSHWTPPPIIPKRYTTWFFIAPWSGGEVHVDDHEVLEHRWMRPADALAEHLPMAPPTIVTLAELVTINPRCVSELARVGEPPAYVTVPSKDADGTLVMLWAGDAGYDTGDSLRPGPRHRMYLPKGEVPRFVREP